MTNNKATSILMYGNDGPMEDDPENGAAVAQFLAEKEAEILQLDPNDEDGLTDLFVAWMGVDEEPDYSGMDWN